MCGNHMNLIGLPLRVDQLWQRGPVTKLALSGTRNNTIGKIGRATIKQKIEDCKLVYSVNALQVGSGRTRYLLFAGSPNQGQFPCYLDHVNGITICFGNKMV
jgi:hypothetical protein